MNELVIVFVSIVRYLSASMVAHWLPRSRSGLVLLSSVFGFVAPECDCGVIPLARRLIAKGVPLYATTTFILAAPVVNPVMLLSTAFAFQEDWRVVGLRIAMTLSVAITGGAAGEPHRRREARGGTPAHGRDPHRGRERPASHQCGRGALPRARACSAMPRRSSSM